MEKYLIITCGGVGKRMMSDLPKQFIPVQGIPLLCRTISAFEFLQGKIHITLTLPQEYIALWQKILRQFPVMEHQICKGGETRFHSVKNALQTIPGNSTVLIHDGVRPFVSQETIDKAIALAEEKGSAVPVSSIHASLRMLNPDGRYQPLKRESVVTIQTPQAFDTSKLKKAYEQDYTERFTDDATVYEAAGNPLFFFESQDKNLKVTTSADLQLAEALIEIDNKQINSFKNPK